MGKKRGKKRAPSIPQECGRGDKAIPMNPDELSAAASNEEAGGVPIGLPVSQEEFEEMQRRALHPVTHQPKGHADPAV